MKKLKEWDRETMRSMARSQPVQPINWRMNMFLHGKDSARLEWGDTLNNPQLAENDQLMKFDAKFAIRHSV